jgi:hypothetical protein
MQTAGRSQTGCRRWERRKSTDLNVESDASSALSLNGRKGINSKYVKLEECTSVHAGVSRLQTRSLFNVSGEKTC